jgi:apoptosis-inducing factor 3
MEEKKIDFLQGIAINDVPSGAIVRGVVDSEDAILVRRGDDFFFIGAQCSHYHGELADGLVVDDTIRCPLHTAMPLQAAPASVVIVGGGAAGLAAADMLRRENYAGPVTMISADDSAPYATWNWPRLAENVIPCPHKNVRVIWTDAIFW